MYFDSTSRCDLIFEQVDAIVNSNIQLVWISSDSSTFSSLILSWIADVLQVLLQTTSSLLLQLRLSSLLVCSSSSSFQCFFSSHQKMPFCSITNFQFLRKLVQQCWSLVASSSSVLMQWLPLVASSSLMFHSSSGFVKIFLPARQR